MTPQPSSHYQGLHYTFLEAAFLEDIGHKPLVLDFGLPTMHDWDAPSYVCDYCKRYVFSSEADKMWHLQRIHGRTPKRKAQKDDKYELMGGGENQTAPSRRQHICAYFGCMQCPFSILSPSSWWGIRKSGHKCKPGWKKNAANQPTKDYDCLSAIQCVYIVLMIALIYSALTTVFCIDHSSLQHVHCTLYMNL